jgi:hypothetical protein
VDRDGLELARAGVYPESIAADVSPERLRRFFVKGDGSYRVNRELRESVIFAHQNLITDPPFSRLDLISCRNSLIHFEEPVQKKVLALLHFALVEGGYLLLGTSETVGQAEDLFEPVCKKWRVYRRIGPTRHDRVQFPIEPPPERRDPASAGSADAPALPSRFTHRLQQLPRRGERRGAARERAAPPRRRDPPVSCRRRWGRKSDELEDVVRYEDGATAGQKGARPAGLRWRACTRYGRARTRAAKCIVRMQSPPPTRRRCPSAKHSHRNA